MVLCITWQYLESSEKGVLAEELHRSYQSMSISVGALSGLLISGS